MKAIILAAGRGSRMQEMTSRQPKCLVKLAGHPLLEWQLAALRGAGISDITIVTGYQAEQLTGHGTKTVHNSEWASSNMVVSLLHAAPLITGPTIIGYSDIVYDAMIVRDLMDAKHCPLSLTYDRDWLNLWQRRFDDPLQDAESFTITPDGRVTKIGQRESVADKIHGQYMGLLKIDQTAMGWIKNFIDANPTLRNRLDMTALLSAMIANGHPIHGVPISGGWCEIDHSSDLVVAEKMVEEGLLCYPSKA
ncbi:MAG: phosphocholine cytidylyltransferase family protein [Magnetococcales bacterium]|nr:phosphocholine cytidylyltransferase family protein [Magnetococcales bacterium]